MVIKDRSLTFYSQFEFSLLIKGTSKSSGVASSVDVLEQLGLVLKLLSAYVALVHHWLISFHLSLLFLRKFGLLSVLLFLGLISIFAGSLFCFLFRCLLTTRRLLSIWLLFGLTTFLALFVLSFSVIVTVPIQVILIELESFLSFLDLFFWVILRLLFIFGLLLLIRRDLFFLIFLVVHLRSSPFLRLLLFLPLASFVV